MQTGSVIQTEPKEILCICSNKTVGQDESMQDTEVRWQQDKFGQGNCRRTWGTISIRFRTK